MLGEVEYNAYCDMVNFFNKLVQFKRMVVLTEGSLVVCSKEVLERFDQLKPEMISISDEYKTLAALQDEITPEQSIALSKKYQEFHAKTQTIMIDFVRLFAISKDTRHALQMAINVIGKWDQLTDLDKKLQAYFQESVFIQPIASTQFQREKEAFELALRRFKPIDGSVIEQKSAIDIVNLIERQCPSKAELMELDAMLLSVYDKLFNCLCERVDNVSEVLQGQLVRLKQLKDEGMVTVKDYTWFETAMSKSNIVTKDQNSSEADETSEANATDEDGVCNNNENQYQPSNFELFLRLVVNEIRLENIKVILLKLLECINSAESVNAQSNDRKRSHSGLSEYTVDSGIVERDDSDSASKRSRLMLSGKTVTDQHNVSSCDQALFRSKMAFNPSELHIGGKTKDKDAIASVAKSSP